MTLLFSQPNTEPVNGGRPLVDRFGRQISYLRISVTDRCDFRCVYCMSEHMQFLPKSEVLSFEEIDQVALAFIARGTRKIRLTGGEPLVRRDIIMALMCQGRVEFAAIEQVHGVRMHEAFAAELAALVPLVESGLVEIEPDVIRVTAAGWYLVRAVAMVFDRHLRADPQRERFSRIV